MLLPAHTVVNKIMDKAKFMKFAELSTASRKEMSENVERLRMANTIKESTIHIEKGKNVVEINVFEIMLKTKEFSDRLVKEIDSAIPKNIVYVLRYEDKAQLVVSYKEKSQNSSKYKVIKIYRTEWKNYKEFELVINGLNLDIVFNNILQQIAEDKVKIEDHSTIKETIEKSIDIEKLKKKIAQLDKKIAKEPQMNKIFALKKEKTLLERELEKIQNANYQK